MIPDTQTRTEDNASLFRGVITDLYEAVLFSSRQDLSSKQMDELNTKHSEKIADVDELLRNITKPLRKYFEANPSEPFKQTNEAITKFARTALEQYKEKINAEFRSKEDEIASTNTSYVTKALKGAETFLFDSPVPIEESAMYIRYVSGGYKAVRKVQCQGNIQYEIILNTAETELLEGPLYFSGLYKGMRIPIRQSSSWITKETVIDREKLDSYLLVNAEFAHGTMIAVFRDEESRSDVRFVLSGSGQQAVFAIEYKDEHETVDINSHPALQNYVDGKAIKTSLTLLSNSIRSLRSNPVRLSALTVDGEDILTSQNFGKLSERVFELLGDRIKDGMKTFTADQERMYALELDNQKVADRLKFLGFYNGEIENILSS
ncbi:MAG TPA: hypothetical protein VJ944_02230 [Thermoplasmataceae archaeon]|nr:hypothetical protein [Thermoplasmataceae archaeon]